jgi:hypothetical protein
MKWDQYDSVLQMGSKDEDVNGNFHKKRYYESMKSSMDTHNNYLNFMPTSHEQTDRKEGTTVVQGRPETNILNQPIPTVPTVVYS